MTTRTYSIPDFSSEEAEATIAGGLAGALQAGLIIQLWDTDSIKTIGAIVGVPSIDGGWITLFGLGVALAVPFAGFVSGSIDSFVQKVMLLSSRSSVLQKILVPLLRRSAFVVTTAALGNIYGVIVGTVFYLFVMPAWLVAVMDVGIPVPYLTVTGLVGGGGWILYGGTLGIVYGLILDA